MPKYLVQASLTREGLQGTLREGGTKRLEAVKKTIESLSGTLESFYYTFGEYDAIGIADFPSNTAAAAFSTTVAAAGVAHTKTTPIITPEEMDEVAGLTVDYRPPGI